MKNQSVRALLKRIYYKNYQPRADELKQLESLNRRPFLKISVSHDEAIERLIKARAKIAVTSAAKAFVYSLPRKQMELRTGLSPMAYAKHFPLHPYEPMPNGRASCRVCGMKEIEEYDPTETWMRFFDWGEGLRNTPLQPALALEFFGELSPVEPSDADLAIFREILARIAAAEPQETGRKVQDRCKDLIPGNKYTREYVFETLGICGLLRTKEIPGFNERFLTIMETQGGGSRPHKNVECDPPLSFWRGRDGINEDAFREFFPFVPDWRPSPL